MISMAPFIPTMVYATMSAQQQQQKRVEAKRHREDAELQAQAEDYKPYYHGYSGTSCCNVIHENDNYYCFVSPLGPEIGVNTAIVCRIQEIKEND